MLIKNFLKKNFSSSLNQTIKYKKRDLNNNDYEKLYGVTKCLIIHPITKVK